MEEEEACCAITLSVEGGIRVFTSTLCSFSCPLDNHSLENCHPDCLAVIFICLATASSSILLMFMLVPDELIS